MITPRMEAFSVNYGEEQLEELFVAQPHDITFERYSGEWFGFNVPFPLPQLIDNAYHILLVATPRLEDHAFIQTLQERADAGVRIYLLLGREVDNKFAIEALAGRCLIRTGLAQNGTLILKNSMLNTADGILLSSGFSDSSYWMRLTPGQQDDYFRIFCYLFWEEARDEHIQQNGKPKKAVKNPLGRIDLNHQDPMANKLLDNLQLSWSNMSQGSLSGIFSQIDLDRWPQASCGVLLSELQQMNVERGIKLCQKVFRLALTEYSGLPQILQADDQQHWMLPQSAKADRVNWCLRLSRAQSLEVIPHLEHWQQQARWQHHRQLSVSDITDSVRFVDQLEKKYQCQPLRTIELDPVQTRTFGEFLDGDTRELVDQQIQLRRDRLAQKIEFTVAIHPPYCPHKASDDPLHDFWNGIQRRWVDQIESLATVLIQEDGAQECLGERIRNALGSFFAGQSHSRRELERTLADLREWNCILVPPSVREEHLDRLNQLADQIYQRRERLTQKVDETQQRHAWERKRQSLLEEKAVANANREKTRTALDEYQRKRPETLEALEQVFLQQWYSWLDEAKNSFHNEKNSNKSNWDFDVLRELDRLQTTTWIKKNLKQLSGDLKRGIKLLLSNEQQAKQKLDREGKTLQQQQHKAESEVAQLMQKLEELGEHFVYTPGQDGAVELSNVLGNRTSNKVEPVNIEWPDEELPQSGTRLRLLGKQRWLVITEDEQLAVAQQDAKRLNAILCTESPKHG